MEKDIIDIVTEKEYIELTSVEREELREFCSTEDEYNQLRDVMLGIGSISFESHTPKKESKQKLDDLFNEAYPKVAPVWYMSVLATIVPKEKSFIQQPLLKVAAIAILALLVYPMFNQDVVSTTEQIALVENADSETSDLSEGVEELNKVSEPQPNESEEVVIVESVDAPGSNNQTVAAVEGADVPTITSLGATTAFTSAAGAAPGFDHPDGVFGADEFDNEVYAASIAETPDVLDLLTATF